jgi:hypothetical protein
MELGVFKKGQETGRIGKHKHESFPAILFFKWKSENVIKIM